MSTSYSEKKVIIVTSTGRTGTSFLGSALSQLIPETYSEHEPDVIMGFDKESFKKIFRYGIWTTVFGRLLGTTGLRNIAVRYYTGKISSEKAVKQIIKERIPVYNRTEKKNYIESYPQWALLLPLVSRVFTDYKVVGIIRHPINYIGSMGSHILSKKKNNWLGINRSSFINQRISNKIKPEVENYGYIPGYTNDRRLFLAWEWALWNKELLKFDRWNGNCEIFLFEDIFESDSTEGIKSLCSYISNGTGGVEDSLCSQLLAKPKNTADKNKIREWQHWPIEIRREIKRLCDPYVQSLGYLWPESF